MGRKKFKNRYTYWVFINISQTRELYKLPENDGLKNNIEAMSNRPQVKTANYWGDRDLNSTPNISNGCKIKLT